MAHRIAQLLALSLLVACGGQQGEIDAAPTVVAPLAPRPMADAWGIPPVRAPGAAASGLTEAARHRDPDHVAIATGLASEDRDTVEAAAWTLARIGGARAAERLLPLLDGEVAGNRASLHAVFGLLEPPRRAPREAPEPTGIWATLEDALWHRYAVVEHHDEASALLFSIARVGGARSMIRLAADLGARPGADDVHRYVDGMEAVAILCARGQSLTRAGVDAVAQGLRVTDPDARRSAVYALGRCAAPSAELLAGPRGRVLAERLSGLVEGTDDETARLSWKALAGLGQLPKELPGNVLAADPPSWTVEVEAVRALGATERGRVVLGQRLLALPLAKLEAPRAHAVHEAARRLRSSIATAPDLVQGLRARLPELDDDPEAPAAARRARTILRCELSALVSISDGDLDRVAGCAAADPIAEVFVRGLEVEALLFMGEGMAREERVTRLLTRAGHDDARRSVRALSALAEVDDARVNEVLRRALASDDVGVVSAAAGAVAARSMDAQKRDPDAVQALIGAVERLTNERAVEARIAAIEALGSLARTAPMPPAGASGPAPSPWLDRVVALAADPAHAVRRAAREALLGQPERLLAFDGAGPPRGEAAFSAASEAISGDPPGRLRLHTERGTIVLDLHAATAHDNQSSVAHLAQKGSFDGLTFHRVVAGFVTQGGDPRGDGYGGPGYILPCEWSNLRYRRGTVGVALAGKDTGGSQLFIAHTPQPHLDGRYTIIGQVEQGMDVVDRLLPHDRIERVEVVP